MAGEAILYPHRPFSQGVVAGHQPTVEQLTGPPHSALRRLVANTIGQVRQRPWHGISALLGSRSHGRSSRRWR